MSRKIIITEEQYRNLVETKILMESIFEAESVDEFKKEARKLFRRLVLSGMAVAGAISLISNMCDKKGMPEDVKDSVIASVSASSTPKNTMISKKVTDKTPEKVVNKTQSDWKLADTKTLATVYNAVPAQCNGDFGHTASMFRLDLYNVLPQRVIAMERTFMKKLGLKYGDVVKIEGTGKYDGVWQIQDTMNKRFKGLHKIDILVPENVKHGQWDNVRLYVLKDKSLTSKYRSNMADQISPEESKKQVAAKKSEWKKKQEAKKKAQQNKKKTVKK
jgi:hypothetical protein